jgi:hypothetical protein
MPKDLPAALLRTLSGVLRPLKSVLMAGRIELFDQAVVAVPVALCGDRDSP